MPSFCIVSEVDKHELDNAVDQANREIGNRFDFKDTESAVEQRDDKLELRSASEFHIQQMRTVLEGKFAKRGLDARCLDYGEIIESGNRASCDIAIQRGIDKELAKRINRAIKDSKIKVQSSIQGEQLRVTGKKRDDLQAVIALIKDSGIDHPLQYINFRD
ncbi:MAG: YajQ family cyclic di-GMP-binding protein [Candidatus Eutrophobiaceae bacterium]